MLTTVVRLYLQQLLGQIFALLVDFMSLTWSTWNCFSFGLCIQIGSGATKGQLCSLTQTWGQTWADTYFLLVAETLSLGRCLQTGQRYSFDPFRAVLHHVHREWVDTASLAREIKPPWNLSHMHIPLKKWELL